MDLFVVNRFTGETTNDVETEEQNKLNKVLKNIHKRKKRKLNTNIDKALQKDIELQESELFKTDVTDIEQNDISNTLEDNELFQNEPEIKKAKLNKSDAVEGFTILGTTKFDTKQYVKRVLPRWLRKPIAISSNLQNLSEKISKIDIDKKLKTNLKSSSFKYLFPVQAGFIPWQLRKTKQANVIHSPDVCVSAPTGSGKTLAFMIPLLQQLIERLKNRNITVKAVRALIVLPTQSLAVQIYNAFNTYSAGTNIKIGIITPSDVTFKNEQRLLSIENSIWGITSRFDVIVSTAGRLVDHLRSSKNFDLQFLEYIIIDEADRVLDSMQDDWLRHLGIHLRPEEDGVGNNILTLTTIKKRIDPQKLLFSATLSSDPENLKKLSLFQPKLFTCVADTDALTDNTNNVEENTKRYTIPNELIEKIAICTASSKPLVLYKLVTDIIQTTEKAKIIVFVNELDAAHRLRTLMCLMARKAFIVKEISNQTPKHLRKELLESFSSGETNVLICTNFIARGIDIPNVDYVISYSVPTHIKTYIHRAGRTARGGLSGVCVTILETHEERRFTSMLKTTRTNFNPLEKINYDENDFDKFSSLYKKSLEQLKYKLKEHERQVNIKTKLKKKVWSKVKHN